jgi:hypothetical protein
VENIFPEECRERRDGIIETNPTKGTSALTNNGAKFLPEPRIGIAWNVFGDGRTSLRSSIGLHHSLLDNLDYRLDQARLTTRLSPMLTCLSRAPNV